MRPRVTLSSLSSWLILPVLALAFFTAFIPHRDYPYPLHIDDWVHLAQAEAILGAGDVTYPDPFSGESTSLGSNLEIGFQVFWGVFQRISGVSWLTIFRFFPAVVSVLAVLAVYIFARRRGFGWEAALFAAIIPTTVGILGPAFLVPVSLGLLFVPLALFVALELRGYRSYLVLFILTCFLVAIHAPSAICLVIILLPFVLLGFRGDVRHSLFLLLALALPFLAPFPWIFAKLLPTAQGLLEQQALPEYVDFPRVIWTYGQVPVVLCLVGTAVLVARGGRKNLGIVLGLLAVLLMLVMFFSFHYGLSIMYERGLLFMMLMVGIVAGAGLAAIRALPLPEKLASRIPSKWLNVKPYLGWGLSLALVGLVLWVALPQRQSIPYYHIVTDEQYRAFAWIKDNVGPEYEKAILDPWPATPFAAVTGRYVYTRIHAFPGPKDEEARRFLAGGCADTDFLRDNGISIVYTELECTNPDLTEVRENVYLLSP